MGLIRSGDQTSELSTANSRPETHKTTGLPNLILCLPLCYTKPLSCRSDVRPFHLYLLDRLSCLLALCLGSWCFGGWCICGLALRVLHVAGPQSQVVSQQLHDDWRREKKKENKLVSIASLFQQ